MKTHHTPATKKQKFMRVRNKLKTFRFMIIAMFMAIVGISGFFTGTLFVLGYLARIRPIHSLPAITLIYYPIIISVLLAILLTTLGSERIVRPIKQLTEATRKVREGDFTVRIPCRKRRDELGQLIESFNLMVDELQHNEIFRTDFINNFSHEFKTPIVSIRGFARQLEKDDLTEEQRREYISIIIAESDRLAGMSANVLLLSKLENQTIVTDRAPFDLDEQIRKEILLLEESWERKNLTITPELQEVRFDASAELLSHVWRNLLANAVKFSPDGGEIRVDLRREEQDGAPVIVVDISDDGPGMDDATVARIFDKFYQGDTSHKTEGNGLGLSIAYRAAVLCGGSIDVRSAPGQGCTFTVRLPE